VSRISRRNFIHTGFAIVFSALFEPFRSQAAPHGSDRSGRLTTGLSGPTYYNGFAAYDSDLQNAAWPAQLSIAQASGLILRQYEGDSQFVGDGNIQGGNNS
jgi:hypothetical protein